MNLMKSGDACRLELMKRLDESQEAGKEKPVRGKRHEFNKSYDKRAAAKTNCEA
jgi:hypothetical protein